jgi:predicted enzyme related to lactoylglutathione lyase
MGNAVVLFEVGAADDAALIPFYRELFGWDLLTFAAGVPGGAFTSIDTRGGEGILGGISKDPAGESWSGFYVETDDLGATLDRATSLGGTTVITGPEFGGTAYVAIFKDPDGLLVGVMQAPGGEQHHPSQGAGAPVTWFEIMGSDAARTERFYTHVFGWTINGSGVPGYSVVDTGAERGIQGAIGGGQDARWAIVYARVADVDQAMARAGELGGTAATDQGLSELRAARAARYGQVVDSMKMAEFRDPAGNAFGIFSC